MSQASSAPCAESRERGLTESTQLAVLLPLIMTSLFALIQAGVWLHARSVVQTAAMTAAERAAVFQTPTHDAVEVGTRITDDAGLNDVNVHVTSEGEIVTAQVSASVPLVVPGPWTTVSATAQRYQEEP